MVGDTLAAVIWEMVKAISKTTTLIETSLKLVGFMFNLINDLNNKRFT